MSSCPTPQILERFALDFLEPAEAERVRDHAAACGECDAQVKARRAEGEAIATAAKQVAVPKVARPARWSRWVIGVAACAVVAISAGVSSFRTKRSPQHESEFLVQRGLDQRCGDRDGAFDGPRDLGTPVTDAYGYYSTTQNPAAAKRDPVKQPEPPPSTVEAPPPPERTPDANTFRHPGTNPFLEASREKLSTFALDVDTASYVVARRYLLQGQLPPPAAIRIEEFLNYFKVSDAPPATGAFAIHCEAAPSRFGKGLTMLRVAVRAKEVPKAARKPAVLTFIVDCSGSMADSDKLGLVKRALTLLAAQLGEGDKVGLVIFNDTARVVLEHTEDRAALREAIDRLQSSGSTNAEAGLREGYALAAKALRAESINRVILCSDGVANVGLTDEAGLLGVMDAARKKGITLTAVGVGMNGLNDALLERLANKGDGVCHYVDRFDAAKRIFVDDLVGTLQTVAMDAKAQIEFDPAIVKRWRLIGYENRGLANEDFRNDKVDAGEVGAGHTVTALYELELTVEENPHRLAKVSLRYREPDAKEPREITGGITLGEINATYEKASPRYRLACVVAEFAELLRKSEHTTGRTLEDVYGEARALADELKSDDVRELAELIKKAEALRR
jgi:Ca-activated chloride channel family protein